MPQTAVGEAGTVTGKMSFEGQVVLVTGAARGLGRSYAELLAARGAHVVLNDIGVSAGGADPSPVIAEAAAADLRRSGGSVIADNSDISTEAGAEQAVATALEGFGRIDAVVNNAGFVRSGDIGSTSLADFTSMIDVHAKGAFLIARAAWRPMKEQGHGRIVLVTSSGAIHGQRGLCGYAAGKGAVIGMTHALAVEGAPLGISVNAIAPLAYTRLAAGIPDEEHRAHFERHAHVDQVAPLAAVLAHHTCPVNGMILDAGGGRFARVFVTEGDGYIDPAPTPERVRDHFDAILSDFGCQTARDTDEAVARTVALVEAQAAISARS